MGYRIQNRRDTADRWAEMNPILLEGDMELVTDNANQYKIGDGIHAWNDLPLRGFTGTISQELGEDENAVVSQKVVTEKLVETDAKLSELGSKVKVNDCLIQGEYYDANGTIQKASTYMRLPIIKASDKLAVIGFNTKIVRNGGVRAFNSTNEYIGDVVFHNGQEKDQIYTLPSGTAYVGIYFKTSVVIPDNAFIESPIGTMTELYMKSNDGLKGINILQDSSLWRGGYINSQGTEGIGPGEVSSYKYVLIPVYEGEQYIYYYTGIRNDLNCFFNNNLLKVGDNVIMRDGINKIVTPQGASYLGLTIQFGTSDSYEYKWLVKDNTPLASIAVEAKKGNIFRIYNVADYVVKGSLWNTDGSIVQIDTFDRCELLPISSNGLYNKNCEINNVRCFNRTKKLISEDAISNDKNTKYITVPDGTAYIGINFRVTNQSDLSYSEAYIIMDSNPLVKTIFDKSDNSSVLSKKKWYFAGDSFSAGIGLETFVGGAFHGKPKIYPYLIALRNGMIDIVNDGISGSAMTYQERDSRTNNAYSVSRYKNIPADADYITLYFGINDANYQIPLGTIDDEVNTTFYGAWNVVMKHIITNHPLAKIGIIITNGSAPQYTAAERAIAKKYGVSYLDMELDDKIPHFLRQKEKVATLGIPADIVNLRTQTYALNPPNDTHPNEKAHEFESTFIEAWLKTL